MLIAKYISPKEPPPIRLTTLYFPVINISFLELINVDILMFLVFARLIVKYLSVDFTKITHCYYKNNVKILTTFYDTVTEWTTYVVRVRSKYRSLACLFFFVFV